MHPVLTVATAAFFAAVGGPSVELPPLQCTDPRTHHVVVSAAEIHNVGGVVEPPKVVKRVEPEWPSGRHNLGVIVVEAVVDVSGRVCAARVLKAPEAALGEALLASLRQWRFAPATRMGKPVAVRYYLTTTLHPR